MPLTSLRTTEDWRYVLTTWCAMLDEYERQSHPDRDVAYWHSEPSLTALLVSAAWRSGGGGLVEFSTKRVRTPSDPGRAGFGDAWIKVGDKWYAVEAKICWSPENIRATLDRARHDLLTLPKEDRGHVGLALCYCVPYLYRKAAASKVLNITATVEREIPSAQLILAYTPQGPTPRDKAEGAYCPGMVALGEFVEWAKA